MRRIPSILFCVLLAFSPFLIGQQALTQSTVQYGWQPQNSGTTFRLLDVASYKDPFEPNRDKILFAVGAKYTGDPAGDTYAILKTTDGGANWVVKYTQIGGGLRSISADWHVNIFAVGDQGLVLHSNDGGETWSVKNPGTNQVLNSVLAYSNCEAWVVGSNGTILRADSSGDQWYVYDSGTAVELLGVGGCRGFVWAVGIDGTILHYDVNVGDYWTPQTSGTKGQLYDVVLDDQPTAGLWAVGREGGIGEPGKCLVLRSEDLGAHWVHQETGVDGWLSAVDVSDNNAVAYAVGGNEIIGSYGGITNETIILKTTDFGATWTRQETGTTTWLNGVTTVDEKQAWAVGDEGLILHTDNGGALQSWYFAEGCTRDGFDEWLCLYNPLEKDITVSAMYMLLGGSRVDKSYLVPKQSRLSVHVNDAVGSGQDVSVRLVSQDEFYAERPMYFDYKQGQQGYSWTGGHCATGAASPRNDWYFAEGTTREGFEEWICIQNPNTVQARVTINYISAGAYTTQKQYDVGPESRMTVLVNSDVGAGQDVSIHLQSDRPVVAERPMYFNYHDKWDGGHIVMGTDAPKTTWNFAEGTTRDGFEEWLCIQNANNSEAHVNVKFLEMTNNQREISFTVGANSRFTQNINAVLGPDVDSSMIVTSDQPVVAERPMYFAYRKWSFEGSIVSEWTGGHDVIGAPAAKTRWFFAEGCTRDNFDEYICVANPNAETVTVTFTFALGSGQVSTYTMGISGYLRCTLPVAGHVEPGCDVSTTVESDKPVVAERPMYFNYNGWTGGHDVVGF